MLIVSYERIYFRFDVDLGFIENVERLEASSTEHALAKICVAGIRNFGECPRALTLLNSPLNGLLGSLKIISRNGKLFINYSYSKRNKAQLDIFSLL